MIEKIAILTDSGSDVPAELAKQHNIFVLPLQVNYKDKSYRDGVDIQAETVFENLEKEVPTTSLPKGEDLAAIVDKIVKEGYTKILTIVLSSGLSGTCNMLKLSADQFDIPMVVIDTKNIGIGSGLTVIKAAQWLAAGNSFDEVVAKVEASIKTTKVFFVLSTLQYLIKGGRIGKVTGMLGTALELKPIITCDDDGVYTTVTKVRGRQKSIKTLVEKVLEVAHNHKKVLLGVAHANAPQEAQALKLELEAALKDKATIFIGSISPALGVHTGPGLLGVGIAEQD